jgi:transposase InsO family protein
VGDEVRLGDSTFTVTGLAQGRVALVGVTGEVLTVPAPELVASPGFAFAGPARAIAPLAPRGLLDGLPEDVVDKAQWWERHIREVLFGLPLEHGEDCRRTEYDPVSTSLRQREIAKVAELRTAEHKVSLTTLRRMRRSYQSEGLAGLVDGRLAAARGGTTDPRLLAAIALAVAGEEERSTGTVARVRRTVEQILREEHGLDPGEVIPSRATFYRLVSQASAGKHTFGSAATRRSLAQRPDGPFGSVRVLRPGEWVHVDSTPLDVRVVLDDGTVDRAELTWLIDIATRSIPAAVLRPTTKAVDASLLLARAVTPEPMRPGWVDALRMSRSVLPHQRLVDIDARLEHAAARPVIVPETIVVDHGKVYLSTAFRAACRAMGVTLQPTHAGSPWEKGVVERSFGSVASLFAQYVAGYVGRNVDRRGRSAEAAAVWSIVELQDLLDEWIVAHWQNRPHDGLRHPLTPARALTPNEMYAALLEVAGYVPVPLGSEDYLELLPVTWRLINAYGIKINHRTYDCPALNPYRRQPSGVVGKEGRWEVHHDPYDVSRIWVRNHRDGGWMTVPWTHLRRAGATPFGEAAWTHARELLAERGGDPTAEAEIAGAVADLLDRAAAGPDPAGRPGTSTGLAKDRKTRRVAARTRSTNSPAWPAPPSTAVTDDDGSPAASACDPSAVTSQGGSVDSAGADDGGRLAAVVPLGVFDARDESEAVVVTAMTGTPTVVVGS